MKTFAPSFYKDFKCKAGACSRTCCAGWEIDIDEASLKKYKAMEGPLGQLLRENIDESGETPCFKLAEGDRCPFLTEEKLCRLILETGSDDILCQICRDHPRFRSFWTGRVEVGPGLACEEAARLVLSSEEPLRLVEIQGEDPDSAKTENPDMALPEDEAWLMEVRNQLWEGLAERSWPTAMHQRLAEYLVFRHIADALYDGRLEERIEFVNQCYRDVLSRLEDPNSPNLEDFIRAAAEFSIEVEYKA